MINVLCLNQDITNSRSTLVELQSRCEELRVVPADSLEHARELTRQQHFHCAIVLSANNSSTTDSLSYDGLAEKISKPVIVVQPANSSLNDALSVTDSNIHFFSYSDETIKYPELIEFLKKALGDEVVEANSSSLPAHSTNGNGANHFPDKALALLAEQGAFDSIYGNNEGQHFFTLGIDGTILTGSTQGPLSGLFVDLDSVRGRPFAELYSGTSYTRVSAALTKAMNGFNTELKLNLQVDSDTEILWKMDVSPLLGIDNTVISIAIHLSDITEQSRKQVSTFPLSTSNQITLLAKLFEKTVEGVTITDADGNIIQVNPAFSAITGYSAQEALGQNPRILKSDRHEDVFYTGMWQSLLKRGEWSGEIWNRRKDGEAYPEWLNIFSVKDESGVVTNYIAMFHDLTEIKHSREQIAFKTYHDGLTGLPNRTYFSSRLRRAISRATRDESMLSLLVLDIDNFKNINESYGHPKGDQLVKQVASRIEECVRSDDTVARIGGDEFAIFCEDVESVNNTISLGKRIISRLKEPFKIDSDEVFASVSIGITNYPEDGLTESELLKNADMALFKAKELGKKQFYFYTSSLHKSVVRRMEMESSLRRALYNNEFVLYYQPKINRSTGKISGFESLMRWDSPRNGFVSPAEFIPILEDMDYITEVGLWALESACADMKTLNDAHEDDLSIAVNLSAKQFEDRWLVENLDSILKRNDFPPHLLTLEITESIIMHNVENAIEKMESISDLGCRISIDDFGTGYSSLSYLKRFPVNELKIDRSFIMDIPEDEGDMAIASAIVSMAKSLGVRVVAEGVETNAQKDFLFSLGCMDMQGYYFSKPIPYTQLIPLLKSWIAK